MRHPFYLANLLLEIGLLLFAGAWWAVPVYLAIAHFAYDATMDEEEADLAALHGDAWTAYAARVPRLLPWRAPCPAAPGPAFSLLNLVYEREIPRLMRLLSLPLGLAWWHEFRSVPGPILERAVSPLHARMLILFVGIQVSSWFVAGLINARRLDGKPRFPVRE